MTDYSQKLEAAISYLGPRYVLHPDRRIKRGDYMPQEIHGADVAATWAKYRAKQEPSVIIRETT